MNNELDRTRKEVIVAYSIIRINGPRKTTKNISMVFLPRFEHDIPRPQVAKFTSYAIL